MIFSIYNISYLKHYKHNLCFPVKYTKNNFFFKVEKNIDKQHVFEKKHIFISNPFSSILDAEIDFPRSYFHSGNSLC